MMKRFKWIISVFIILLGISGHSQSMHYFRCLSVNELSDVTLTWEAPTSAGEFSSYKIFHAEISNPLSFQEIVAINNYTTTSFVHTGSSAGQMINLYYIETELTGGGTIFSDTLRTLFMQASDNGEGEVLLSWNNMHNPPLPSVSNNFNILLEYPLFTWSHLGSTPQNSYTYEISVCHDSLSFQVILQDDYGCLSASNIAGGLYQDIIKPPMPLIDSVSIDPSDQEIVVGWQQSTAPDAIGYLIYRYINSNWIPIDTLWGKENTIYKDIGVQPCNQSQAYALATLDSCGNKSLGTFLLPQQSILLNDISFNPCEASNMLSWSPYINMQPFILGYQVYASREGGPFQLIGTTSAGQTSFNHEGIEVGNHYNYYVRAFNANNYGSSSCIKPVFAFDYGKPAFHYLANVSVENNQYLEIKTYLDTAATIESVRIYRMDPSSGSFDEIDEISPVTEDILTYNDQSVNIQQSSYQYKISLIDSCGNELLFTNTMPSILLQGNIRSQNEIFLEWNEFSGWNGSIEAYEVYRVINGTIEPSPVSTLAPGTTEYIDVISESLATISSFDYIVAAVEADDNAYGFQEISYSNILQLQGTPSIYMPNAFRPGGINKIFKPVGNYVDQSNYTFQIFDRWGKLIFETQNFAEGWDGVYNGKSMPVGVYVYLLNYQILDGSIASQKGTFVLVR